MGKKSNGGGPGFLVDLFTLNDPKAALIASLVLWAIFISVRSVVALYRRMKKTWRNKEECRRLMQRVEWLRRLRALLRPESQERGAARALREVLARRLDATVRDADRLARSWAMSCCLCGFARCNAQARNLERAKAGVDEVYVQVLPVVSQIDARHHVVHILADPPHGTTSSSQHGGDNGNPFANSLSGIQLPAGFDGIEAPNSTGSQAGALIPEQEHIL